MIEMICNTENDERCFLYVFRECGHQMGKKRVKENPHRTRSCAGLCGNSRKKISERSEHDISFYRKRKFSLDKKFF